MRPERDKIVEPSGWQGPLCKFGPGGDFVAAWQPPLLSADRKTRGPQDSALPNPLARLLASAVEVAAVVFGLRRTLRDVALGAPSCVVLRAACRTAERRTPNVERTAGPDEPTDGHTEKVRNAPEHSRSFGATDPPAAPVIKDGRRFSRESLLFPDVRRNGRRIEDKPKHHIRAYRGAAKKGAAVRFVKQGTLFDAQPGSVRIA